ncbi:MAG: hypothetical protein HOH77_20985, partial [Candidatus Latescibacteria bacterium]|nr:hypothetical protein [Candidatus Latescibacterota bacterium]
QALEKWYGISPPTEEKEERHPEGKLHSLTPEFRQEYQIPFFNSVLQGLGVVNRSQASSQLAHLQKTWTNTLGDTTPRAVETQSQPIKKLGQVSIQQTTLICDGHVPIPLLILTPPHPRHLIVTLAQAGKQDLLTQRSDSYEALLDKGIALCLPDLPSIGETAPDDGRTFRSAATTLSANLLMFGQTSIGVRLQALRTVVSYLSTTHAKIPISLWGDSLALTNPVGFEDPLLNTDPIPHQAEPAGGLLALLTTLFEPNIHSLAIRGMITGYQSLLENIYCYLPHDAILPGALLAGDLCDIASLFAPKPMLLTHCVDGRNCPASDQMVQDVYKSTSLAYAPMPENLKLHTKLDVEQWFMQHLT